jgi:hypothetical protein
MSIHQGPHELAISGVYLPPLLVAAVLAVILALSTGWLLNHIRLSRYFSHPSLVLLSLMVIYTVIIESLLFGG